MGTSSLPASDMASLNSDDLRRVRFIPEISLKLFDWASHVTPRWNASTCGFLLDDAPQSIVDLLCADGMCAMAHNDAPLYTDDEHLGTTKCAYALRKGHSAKSSSCIVP